MPDWPASLRFCPVNGTYTENRVDSTIRTSVDTGPDFVRRRFTAVPTNISLTLPKMSHAEYAVFQTWFRDDLSDGVLSFDADHPITGVAGSFRFRSPYRAAKVGKGIVVQLDLELLP